MRDPARRSDMQRRRIGQLENEVAELRSSFANATFEAMTSRSTDQLRRIGHLERDIRDQENDLQLLKERQGPGKFISQTAQKQIDDLNAQIKRQADKHRRTMEDMEQEATENRRKNQTSETRIEELSRE